MASPGRVSRRDLQEQLRRNPPIRRPELAFLERYAADIVTSAPNAQVRAEVSAGARTLEDASVTGTSSSLAIIRDLNLERGRFLRETDDQTGATVAIIGAEVADALFPTVDPLGRSMRIAGRRFDVIGVQCRVGSAGGGSLDRYVWIPLRAHERAFGPARSLQVFAKAREGLDPVAGEDRARVSLRAKRALGPGVPDNFDILTPDAARGFVANLSERIGAAAVPISLMALLVAVVVVTNTVLVSVTQRTREIGIRRAVGAPQTQIIREILAESVLMSLAGGVAGAAMATALLSVVAGANDLPLEVSPSTLGWGLAASSASGIAAGWYPARRATRLTVVAAMRSE